MADTGKSRASMRSLKSYYLRRAEEISALRKSIAGLEGSTKDLLDQLNAGQRLTEGVSSALDSGDYGRASDREADWEGWLSEHEPEIRRLCEGNAIPLPTFLSSAA